VKPLIALAVLFLLAQPVVAEDKLPVPEDDAQQQAVTLIANLYKAEYDAAKTPEQKSVLAKKMLQVGKDSKDDPTGRYVLFRLARDIVAGAGDVETAMAAVSETTSLYEVDALALKADVLAKVVKAIRLPKEHQDLAVTIRAACDDAVSQDRFDLAKSINTAALESARLARSAELVKQVVAQGKELDEIHTEYQKVQAAFNTLKTAPTDPEANYLVGRYQCFIKGDWENGLLMLALGSNETLKKLAEAELAEKSDPYVLGNAWWDYSEKADGRQQAGTRQRAAVWYKQALPKLAGLSKKVVESRLGEVTSELTVAENIEPRRPSKLAQQRKKVAPDAVEIDGHYYKVFLQKDVPWDVAKAACENMGGRLACVETDELRERLAALKGVGSPSRPGNGKIIWVGGFQNQDGTFSWLNGNPFHGFGKKDPNNWRVLFMIGETFGYRPNSGKATNVAIPYVQGFICEWEE
jgi:hypothetical protein